MTQRAAIAEGVGGLGFRSVWGPIADVIVFIAATGQGMRLANAHLVSFAVATILNYFLIIRRAAAAAGRSTDWRLHVHLLVVSSFAVCLRGAVLGLLTNVWGWSEHVAIVVAAMAAMALALPGYNLAVRTTTWTLGGGEQWRRVALYLVVVGFLLRLVYITQVELLREDC
jgi:dolichol-phosphate mannosyltransferase